jgi:hypothetical protein
MFNSQVVTVIFAVLIALSGIAVGWLLRSRKEDQLFQAALADSFPRVNDGDNDNPFAFAGVDRIHADRIKFMLSSMSVDPTRYQEDNEMLRTMVEEYLRKGAIYPAAYAIKVAELKMNGHR